MWQGQGGGYGGPPPPQGWGPPPQQGWGPPQPPPQGYYEQNQYGPPPPGLDAWGNPAPPLQERGYPQQQAGYGYDRAAPPPPSGAQHFGSGAPEGYTFQYSQCTGRRKALLIGINYFGTESQLRGCINDVTNVSNFLVERYNYRWEDMVILTDDQQDPIKQPTKMNIVRAMSWLVADAQPNDALFMHYSGKTAARAHVLSPSGGPRCTDPPHTGHGGQTEDLDGDEEDGYDEVIYPVDYKQAGHLVDDEIHDRVVRPLQPGVRLTAIFDSCHSGTAMDLPYVYSTKGVLKEPNLASEAGKGLLGAFSAYTQGNMAGVASSIMGFAKLAYKGEDAYQRTVQTKTSPADVIMWSGSKDDQTS